MATGGAASRAATAIQSTLPASLAGAVELVIGSSPVILLHHGS
jgi:hypothetical protein